jgi:hypothetical protein
MLLDWFTHIGDTMAYGGEIVDRYLAWHPIDHIYWDLARRPRAVVMDIGARSALMSPINRIVCRRFRDEMVRAWVRHNIEEVGQLEYLLPQLKSGEAEPAQRA